MTLLFVHLFIAVKKTVYIVSLLDPRIELTSARRQHIFNNNALEIKRGLLVVRD